MNRRARFSALAVALAFAGCATTAKFEQNMNSWLGRQEVALIANFGPPQSSYTLQDGSRVLQFSQSRTVVIPGSTYQQPVTSNTTGTVSSGYRSATYNSTTTSYQTVQNPSMAFQQSCTVNFTVDSAGIVRAWNAQGNDCKAR